MNHKLKLVDADEPTRAEIEMARITQAHSEWSGPCGKVEGWKPIETQSQATLEVDEILRRTGKYIAHVGSRVPWYIKLLRRLRGIK